MTIIKNRENQNPRGPLLAQISENNKAKMSP